MQHEQPLEDVFNPKFTFHSPVSSLELDSDGTLPASRLMRHVQLAIESWCDATPEDFVVGDTHLEPLTTVAGPVELRIDVWVEDLDSTSCTYGFLLSSEDGTTPFARGDRTIRKVTDVWTTPFRARHAKLMKDLPAYA